MYRDTIIKPQGTLFTIKIIVFWGIKCSIITLNTGCTFFYCSSQIILQGSQFSQWIYLNNHKNIHVRLYFLKINFLTMLCSLHLRWRVHINIHIIHKLIIYSFAICNNRKTAYLEVLNWRSCWRITWYLPLYQGSNEEPWVAGCQIIALQKRAK